jgi:hypothetical protein
VVTPFIHNKTEKTPKSIRDRRDAALRSEGATVMMMTFPYLTALLMNVVK